MKTVTTLQLLLIFSFSILLGNTKLLAQPVNDLIEDAIDLDQGPYPYSELAIAFQNATFTNDETPGGSCSISLAGIWYKFTATSVGNVSAVIVNPTNSYVIFFSGPNEDVTNGNELTYIDVPSNSCALGNSSTINTVEGTTYYIYMRNGSPSDVLININSALVPENDLIENAIDLNQLSSDLGDNNFILNKQQFQFTTNTNDGGQSGCDTDDMPAMWFKLHSSGVGEISGFMGFDPPDSAITIYSAANGNATQGSDLTYINATDNTCGNNNLGRIITEPNTFYYFFVYSQHDTNSIQFDLAEEVLSTSENILEGFSFFPNPVSNEINLNAKSIIDEVVIFNLLGQQVASEKIGSNRKSIDLSYLKSGLYLMNVTSEGITESFKIIKR